MVNLIFLIFISAMIRLILINALYQPQLGTWQSSTLSYNQYKQEQQRYIVDATEVLECNTDWLEEGWNELMKQITGFR
jgi:hypothetical protein